MYIGYTKVSGALGASCIGFEYLNETDHIETVKDAKQLMVLHKSVSYEIVPHSCIRNLFGSNSWVGIKPWPQTVK